MKVIIKLLWLASLMLPLVTPSREWPRSTPTPSPWPEQFHALLYMNMTSSQTLQITNLWYDWPRGRNVNIIQKQLGELLYDVEWNNGTSFYYTLGAAQGEGEGEGEGTCEIMYFEVGITRPDFLDGANYLGTLFTDGFLCHVWEKVDFIWYYEDVLTRRPVRWDFYDGMHPFIYFCYKFKCYIVLISILLGRFESVVFKNVVKSLTKS